MFLVFCLKNLCQSSVYEDEKDLREEFCLIVIEEIISRGVCIYISSVQSLSRVWLFATPWTAAHQASLSITNSRSLLKLMSIESVMPSNHLILCYPLLLPPSIFPSVRVFSSESVLCIRWPEYWSFSFSISPSSGYSGLISLGWTGWISLQSKGLSRVFSQYCSSKVSIFQCSAFFIVPALTSIRDYWKNHPFD